MASTSNTPPLLLLVAVLVVALAAATVAADAHHPAPLIVGDDGDRQLTEHMLPGAKMDIRSISAIIPSYPSMTVSKPLLALAVVALLVAGEVQQVTADGSSSAAGGIGGGRTLLAIDCPKACEARCGRNWKNEMCNKMCNICCGKCSCVPSGTGQDTRNECPCYANMKNTKNGKPKCP